MSRFKKIFLLGELLLTGALIEAQATGWLNPAWGYRSQINVTNPGGTALTNFQVHVTLGSTFTFGQAKSDGSDIRFTASDGTTLLPFWVENWNASASSASIWVNVPSITSAGATVYLYYGNPATTSAANGNTTFDFFDDFEPSANSPQGYFQINTPQTVMVQSQSWEDAAPHTLAVLDLNQNGSTYWGYYGLQQGCAGVGLAYSNDLVTWTKYAGNPLFTDARWPTTLTINGVIYMLYEKDYCSTSYIELATSTDGIHFTDVKTIVQAQTGYRNQNPNLFFNPVDGKYYIYWYYGNDSNNYNIKVRSASLPTGLDNISTEATLLTATTTLAAPNVLYYEGTYFLSTEVLTSNGLWNVVVYSSSSPTGTFTALPGNPVVANNTACMFQMIVGNALRNYVCNLGSNGVWTLQSISGSLNRNAIVGLDPTKWGSSQGSWGLVQDTQQDGTVGWVAQGNMSARQILPSLYTGTNYSVEVYGKQMSGRVWGLGARVTDANNLYSANLYDDLNTTSNLYNYKWLNGSATTLGGAAVGPLSANTWYKMTIKAGGSAIDVFENDISRILTSDTSLTSGGVALYGEQGTTAEFNNLLVRKYALTDPTATLGTNSGQLLSSLTLNPTSVVGGNTSVGTLKLATGAPVGGIVVALSSTNPAVASVPANVSLLSGATSATFMISTSSVSTTVSPTISASYNSQTQSATLNVTPLLSSVTVNPSSVFAGSGPSGIVTLAVAASGSVMVTLSSSNPSAVSVPASVTISSGALTGVFQVSTFGVATSTQVTVTAAYGGATQTCKITVTPLLSSVSVNPATIAGGTGSTGTVTFAGAAPANGAIVMLSSSSPSVASVPTNVTVAAGSLSANFAVTTSIVSQSTPVTITASYNGASQTTGISVYNGSGPPWFSTSWLYRSAIALTNAGGTTLSNYQVHVQLSSTFNFALARADGADLRFTAADGSTALPYWIESWSPIQASASLWVQVPSIPASGATVYLYYGNSSATTSTASGDQTFNFFDDFNASTLNTAKWTASGGSWSTVSDTREDGSVGYVAHGVTSGRQILSSSYSGTDYIVQVNGKQVAGRVFGLGVRTAGISNLYSINLYDDLGSTNNLYVYSWINNTGGGATAVLGSAALGTINANTWYTMSAKIHGSEIDVYQNGALKVQVSNSSLTSGGIALYGEGGTTAEFSNVYVRQYTAMEPTVTVGAAAHQ